MKSTICLGIACSVLTLAALPCSAAITVGGMDSASPTGTGTVFSLTGFDAAGTDKLVVTASGEGNSGSRSITSITYGGIAMSEAVEYADSALGLQTVGIYYLDDYSGAVGTTIVVTWDGNVNGTGIGALTLNGTADGVGATHGADGLSATVTTGAPGSLVVGTFVANGGTLPTYSPGTTLYSSDNVGSAVGAAGYQIVPTAGPATATFTGGGTRPATAVAEFTAIPEPSSLGLAGLALAGLALRRRR